MKKPRNTDINFFCTVSTLRYETNFSLWLTLGLKMDKKFITGFSCFFHFHTYLYLKGQIIIIIKQLLEHLVYFKGKILISWRKIILFLFSNFLIKYAYTKTHFKISYWLTTLSVDPHSRQFYSLFPSVNREFPLKFSIFFSFSIFFLKIGGLHWMSSKGYYHES